MLTKKTENEHKIATDVTRPRPPIKEEEEPKVNDQVTEKCGWGPDCPFCMSQEKKEEKTRCSSKRHHPNQNHKSRRLQGQRL